MSLTVFLCSPGAPQWPHGPSFLDGQRFGSAAFLQTRCGSSALWRRLAGAVGRSRPDGVSPSGAMSAGRPTESHASLFRPFRHDRWWKPPSWWVTFHNLSTFNPLNSGALIPIFLYSWAPSKKSKVFFSIIVMNRNSLKQFFFLFYGSVIMFTWFPVVNLKNRKWYKSAI